jgi:hypothetical protein
MKMKLKYKIAAVGLICILAFANIGISSNEGQNDIDINGLYTMASACECEEENATYCLQGGAGGWCMERSDCCGWECPFSASGDCHGTFYF